MAEEINKNKRILKRIYDGLWELIIVIIGIFVALQVDNFKTNIQSNKKEKVILKHILNALEFDQGEINWNINAHKKALASDSILLQCIKYKCEYNDSLSHHFPNTLLDFIFITNTAPYENLKSIGMDIIKNDVLKLKIAEIYDFHYERLHKFEEEFYPAESFRLFNDFFLNNFNHYTIEWDNTTKVSKRIAYPNNYNELMVDPKYQTLLQNDILWRNAIIKRYLVMEEKVESLMLYIKNYIY